MATTTPPAPQSADRAELAGVVHAARQGDRVAQAELLRSLQDVWFRFAASLLGSVDDAREATQETALRVLAALPRFRGDSAVSTWSLGIALNVVREMRRRQRRADRIAFNLFARGRNSCATDRPDESGESPNEVDERMGRLRRLLSGLTARQQEAVVLRYLNGLDVATTARLMRAKPGTVKATVHQALLAMRRRAEQELST